MKWGQNMFSSQRFLIQISSDYLRDVINVMSWWIRVSLKCMQFSVLRHLSNKTFKWIFISFCLVFRLGSFLLFELLSLLFFDHFLFLLSFALNVLFHTHNFVLNWIKFLMKLFIFISLCVQLLLFLLLSLLLIMLKKLWRAWCFC